MVLGLYVCGEVVCVFVYGVNRLGVNFLFDFVVFGRVCVNIIIVECKLGDIIGKISSVE